MFSEKEEGKSMKCTQLVEHRSNTAGHNDLLCALSCNGSSSAYVIRNDVGVQLKDGTLAVLLSKGQGRLVFFYLR